MGTLSLLGLGGGKPNSMSSILGGGEDPKPNRKVFKTQAEIDAANAEARRFANSRGHHFANDVFVARKIGDPVPLYIDEATGKEYVGGPSKKLKYNLPNDIKLSDIKSANGAYWYEDPVTGDVVDVASDVVNLPRFRTEKKVADKNLADRRSISILTGGETNSMSSAISKPKTK